MELSEEEKSRSHKSPQLMTNKLQFSEQTKWIFSFNPGGGGGGVVCYWRKIYERRRLYTYKFCEDLRRGKRAQCCRQKSRMRVARGLKVHARTLCVCFNRPCNLERFALALHCESNAVVVVIDYAAWRRLRRVLRTRNRTQCCYVPYI